MMVEEHHHHPPPRHQEDKVGEGYWYGMNMGMDHKWRRKDDAILILS